MKIAMTLAIAAAIVGGPAAAQSLQSTQMRYRADLARMRSRQNFQVQQSRVQSQLQLSRLRQAEQRLRMQARRH